MSAFTKEEIAKLYEPFPLAAHSIREGYKNKEKTRVRWFVYLDRIAVQQRLDELFPGEWEFSINEVHRAETHVNITATLTIRGMSRSFNGGNSLNYDNETVTEDLEKGAMTDTFRRVASMWGLGAYLYKSVYNYTAGYANWQERSQRELEAKRMFEAWYNEQYTEITPQDTPPRTSKRVNTDHVTPHGNGEKKADESTTAYNVENIIARVDFMHKARKHTINTVNSMIEAGEIEPTDTDVAAAWKVFEHRVMSQPYFMNIPKVCDILTQERIANGSNVPVGDLKQYVKDGGTMESAWAAVVAYQENKDAKPAKPKNGEKSAPAESEGKTDIPF